MTKPQIIWEDTLDGDKYDCAVTRVDDRHGKLTVKERATTKTIISEVVPLAYGAAFGPDIADIMAWQELICSQIPKEDDETSTHDASGSGDGNRT